MDYTIKELAEKLDVSTKTIHRYRAQGKFPNAYKLKNRVYIPENDIDGLLRTGTGTADEQKPEIVRNGQRQGQVGQVGQARHAKFMINWKWLGIYYERETLIKDKDRWTRFKLSLLNMAISGSSLLESVGKALKGQLEHRKALLEHKERR